MAVGDLSGGERRRIELLLVLAGVPNLLLLDEPTNDLDLDTLGVFEEFLDGWEGALVAASHDRYFLERVCSDIVSIEPDHTIRHHPGGWVAYRAWKAASTMSPPGEGSGPGEAKTPRLPRRNPARSEARLSYKESRELETLDDLIRSLESGIAAVGEELERAAGDWEAAASLGEQLADLHRRLERAEDRWLELSERA
jgi:ATP-binding cassette subfamily F protein uup